MCPAVTIDDLRYGSSRKLVLLANVFLHHVCCQLAYRQYVLLSQFRHAMLRSSIPLTMLLMQSVLLCHIVHVVSMRTKYQMARIDTQ